MLSVADDYAERFGRSTLSRKLTNKNREKKRVLLWSFSLARLPCAPLLPQIPRQMSIDKANRRAGIKKLLVSDDYATRGRVHNN